MTLLLYTYSSPTETEKDVNPLGVAKYKPHPSKKDSKHLKHWNESLSITFQNQEVLANISYKGLLLSFKASKEHFQGWEMRTKSVITRSAGIGTVFRNISFLPVYSSFFLPKTKQGSCVSGRTPVLPKEDAREGQEHAFCTRSRLHSRKWLISEFGFKVTCWALQSMFERQCGPRDNHSCHLLST